MQEDTKASSFTKLIDSSKGASHRLRVSENEQVQSSVFQFPYEPPVVALLWGKIDPNRAPLVRIHSRCLYGEVFRSLDCDCRAQLELATHRISREGEGILIYLEQEGRGCGLINKARAMGLKDEKGLDTVDAYRELGLQVDTRSYDGAARLLKMWELKRVRLLTNNPEKVRGIANAQISVEQVPLRTTPTAFNIDYLRVKQDKLRHDLGLYTVAK